MRDQCKKIPGRSNLCAVAACCMIAAVLAVLLPTTSAAHPPKAVVLSYDQAKHTLEVRITHSSPMPTFHRIKTVEIKKNGQTVSVNDYKEQPAQDAFSYVYPLEVGRGDVLEVTATCNMFGSKTEKLTAP